MEDLLTVRQVSIILKVHQLTVRRYITQGKLKAVRVGGNVRISQRDLQAFSDVYIARSRPSKLSTEPSSAPFSPSDPLFRLQGRGVSLDNLERG